MKKVLYLKREIAVDGKPCQVEIMECPVGTPFRVKINDKLREVLLEQDPKQKNFTLKVDKESYLVELPALGRSAPFMVKVNNTAFKVEIKMATQKMTVSTPSFISIQGPRSTRSAAEGAILAPMAGKIVSVRVKKGDAAKMGAVLCVLEAMKMENEIIAPKSGVVEEIMAQEGKAVNEGDVLVILK